MSSTSTLASGMPVTEPHERRASFLVDALRDVERIGERHITARHNREEA